MIYLDNAATTLVKPKAVECAVLRAMQSCGNPGRSGHRAAMHAANIVFSCRETVAELFELEDPTRVIFTQNATHALNIAIQSLLRNGGHAVVSGYEHNSVIRPLSALEERGVTYTIAHAPLFSPKAQIAAMERSIRPETVCIICNHVSNVFGCVQDICAVNALCKKYGLDLVLDLSQSAGIIPVSVKDLSEATYLCMPGHKGLYGPQGTGILICCKAGKHYSVIQGGTGSESKNLRQPEALPEGLESGTLNVPGIAGLREGIRFVMRKSCLAIDAWEKELKEYFLQKACNIPNIHVYYSHCSQCGVVSLTSKCCAPETLGARLAEKGIALRSGLHCAPIAHESAGTLPQGTLRISFSAFNTKAEIEKLCLWILKTNS